MAKPTSIAMATSNLGNTDFVLEMSSTLKSTGYQAGEKPTHKNFNWWMNQTSIWAEDYLDVRLESNLPTLLRSSGTATWNGSDLVLSANLDISFRKLNGEQINRIAATTLSFSDGQVLVLNKDKISASPVTLAAGAYASLDSGEYVIIAESSLTEDNIENECLIFRRSGTNLECLVNGLIYPTGATITFGSAATTAAAFSGVLAAANGGTGQSSYAVGDLLYASGSSALSKLADVATGNVLISGGVGVAPSWGKVALTTHVSGTLPVANGGTGVTTSTGSGANVLGTSPALATPTITGATLSGTFSGAANFTGNISFDTNVLYADATNNRVYLGAAASTTVDSQSYAFQQTQAQYFNLKYTNSTGSAGVYDAVYCDSSSPADLDDLYTLKIYANNSLGNESHVGGMEFTFEDVTAGTLDCQWALKAAYDGSSVASPLLWSSSSGFFRIQGDLSCSSDNIYDLGTAAIAYKDIYSNNAVTVTSDERLKEEIIDNPLGLDYLKKIKTKFFKWKKVFKSEKIKRTAKIKDKKTGELKEVIREKLVRSEKLQNEKRFHAGILAQQALAALPEGVDFGGVSYDPVSDKYTTRPAEWNAIFIKAIQELDQEIQNLKKQNKKGEK